MIHAFGKRITYSFPFWFINDIFIFISQKKLLRLYRYMKDGVRGIHGQNARLSVWVELDQGQGNVRVANAKEMIKNLLHVTQAAAQVINHLIILAAFELFTDKIDYNGGY